MLGHRAVGIVLTVAGICLGLAGVSGATDPLLQPARTVADRAHADLVHGTDVVIASYVGLWFDCQRSPRCNLYWGARYGHSTMMTRQGEIRARLPFLEVTDYAATLERQSKTEPLAVKVFEAPVPNAKGRLKIVTLAYGDMSRAVREMAEHLKTGRIPPTLAGDDQVRPLLERAYAIGYWGHNIYYGGDDVDRLQAMSRTTDDLPRGVFFVGCQSARWYPRKFLDEKIEPLLFTTSNMAPEAYVGLALYDALARGLSAQDTRQNVARAYGVYQRLGKVPLGYFLNDREAIEAKSAGR
jgi:hypothetical protein